MPKYLFSWEESVWYDLEIEAESRQAAIDIFAQGEYDSEDVRDMGQEIIPDTLEIEEI